MNRRQYSTAVISISTAIFTWIFGYLDIHVRFIWSHLSCLVKRDHFCGGLSVLQMEPTWCIKAKWDESHSSISIWTQSLLIKLDVPLTLASCSFLGHSEGAAVGPWDLASTICKCPPANSRAGKRIQWPMSRESSSPQTSFQSCLGPALRTAKCGKCSSNLQSWCLCSRDMHLQSISHLHRVCPLFDPHAMYSWGLFSLGQSDWMLAFPIKCCSSLEASNISLSW